MSRLAERLTAMKADGRKAFSAFITAGDPQPEATVPAMHALVRGGADIIELGVPFSDPEADGPSIQAASERALAHSITLASVLGMVQTFRREDAKTPVVLMGYLNQFLRMGYGEFSERAAQAGIDGVIVVNMPPEESAPFGAELRRHELDMILLVAPTTGDERAAHVADHASGFIYYVSYKGVTGADRLDVNAIGQRLAALRQRMGELPVLVGFGIKDGASAAAIAPYADGVVVGSALVNTVATTPVDDIPACLQAQAQAIRDALDAV